ncbi:MAG: hypothetical protein J6E48_00285 [Prevotella sp.]|nr:hypothetical protein [Prevotella sp.]
MVKLKEGQYLSNVMTEIPSNCILSKRIPGCGATTLELTTDRNSIIIVPNVPVIQSKVKKFPNMKGVFEDVKVGDVVNYLKENNQYKIMTTPESFLKVKKACELCCLNIYTDFFLLDDECHQLVKDVDYRGDIVLPMDDFFKFERKALVSATPIGFSDPRFKGFNTIEVCADYDYQQKILVVHTYSIAKTVREYLESHKNNKVCIFFNSVDGIYSLIEQFNLKNDATIYCAPKSCGKLLEHGFTNAYDLWSADTMKQYNFFTGRFYTAFDLELDYKPDLLMIADPYIISKDSKRYSLLDVDTDCIQICGRFRKGISSATHIFRTNPNIVVKTREELEKEIYGLETAYNTVKAAYDCANNKDLRYGFGDLLATSTYRKYLYPNQTKNYFRIDNAINEKLVENRYKFQGQLEAWYEECHYFSPTFDYDPYNPKDEKLKIVKTARSKKDRRRQTLQLLDECKKPYSEYESDFISKIRQIDPLIVDAYEILGKKGIEELKYSEKKMYEVVIKAERTGINALKLIKNSFKVGRRYTNTFIVKELTRIFGELKIHPERTVKGSMIKDYFQAEAWSNGKNRGYRLIMAIV